MNCYFKKALVSAYGQITCVGFGSVKAKKDESVDNLARNFSANQADFLIKNYKLI